MTFGADKSGELKTAANIKTSDDDVTFTNKVTLSGGDAKVLIDTDSGAGNILFKSEVLTGGQSFTLDAGESGDITADKSITGGGAFTVTDGAVQQYTGAIEVASLDIQDATTAVTLDGAVKADTSVDINSLTGKLTQNASVTAGTSLDYDAAGTIDINAGITATQGPIDIDAVGLTTITEPGAIDSGGAVTFGADKSGALKTAANIKTSDDDVTFTNKVTLSGGDAKVLIDTTGSAAVDICLLYTSDAADE